MDAEFRKALRIIAASGREAELARFLFDSELGKICEVVRGMDESMLKNLRVVVLERLAFLNLRREFRWHTRDGRVFTVGDIADEHLLNILRCYERGSTSDGGQFNGGKQHEKFLRMEAQERGILKPGERLLEEQPGPRRRLKIHYTGLFYYERSKGMPSRTVSGWPVCCGATQAVQAVRFAREGRVTQNPNEVTCETCLNLLRRQSLLPQKEESP